MHKIITIQQKKEVVLCIKLHSFDFEGCVLFFKKIPKAEGNLLELNENAYKVFIIQRKFYSSLQCISTGIQAKN